MKPPWKEISQRRREDLLVYLALARFRKRPKITQLPMSAQRDIKAFLGSYRTACQQADELLFSAGAPDAIDAACCRASVGQLVDNALTVHESALPYLEPLLRIYEGCARALVGQIDEANLIKIHRFSGKVTYIAYPDFEKNPHPPLKRRLKISLRSLRIDDFDYSDWDDPPILFRKNEFLHEDHSKNRTHTQFLCCFFSKWPLNARSFSVSICCQYVLGMFASAGGRIPAPSSLFVSRLNSRFLEWSSCKNSFFRNRIGGSSQSE